MAIAQKQQQMAKLVSIADARTRRALATVVGAQQQLEAARHRLEQCARELAEAGQSVARAEGEIRKEPANEQHRLWLIHCQTLRQAAEIAYDDARMQCDAALAHLANAQKAYQRQQVRRDHVEGAAHKLQQDAMREVERRKEDDQQGSGKHLSRAGVL